MEISEIRAVVRSLDGPFALVSVEQGGGCGRCHEPGGCGGQQLTQMFCGNPKAYRVLNAVDASVGQTVTVALPDAAIRRGANLVYGLPLLGVFLGAGLGMHVQGDTGAMIGAAVGVFAAWLVLRQLSRSGLENSHFQPYIVTAHSSNC